MKRFFRAIIAGIAIAACAASAYAVAPEVGKTYAIKFLSNGNYLSSVDGNFKCQESLDTNGFWQIKKVADGFLLYNPVLEVYAYRSDGRDTWSMYTDYRSQITGIFNFVSVSGKEDTYVLAMRNNGCYVGADNDYDQNNCDVYGDKTWQYAATMGHGLVQFEELPSDPIDILEPFTYTYQGKELTYKITDNNECKVYNCPTNATGAIIIPELVEYDNIQYSVTAIGNCAFDGCWYLTSIEIPNSVTAIGHYAFYTCWGLESIEIPNSVNTIGNSAFESTTHLTSIGIPNSVTDIGNSAFAGCKFLTSIEIPNSVTCIGDKAFLVCNYRVGKDRE